MYHSSAVTVPPGFITVMHLQELPSRE